MSAKFYGTVMTRDWMHVPWTPGQVKGFTGECQVVAAADLLGHDVNDRDSNWAIVVSGANLDVVVLGCQVASVVRRQEDSSTSLTAMSDFVLVP